MLLLNDKAPSNTLITGTVPQDIHVSELDFLVQYKQNVIVNSVTLHILAQTYFVRSGAFVQQLLPSAHSWTVGIFSE